MKLTRRSFLEIAAGLGGATALSSGLFPWPARAADGAPRLFVFAYFSGGWDQLLVADPRPNNAPAYSKASAYAAGGSGIYPAYDLVTDAQVQALLAQNPTGVQQVGALSFGPAVPASLLAHAAEFSVCRGVTMDTLTHEVGRRYFLTGKFPRGVAANGSSLPTVVAGQVGQNKDLPNLAIAIEAYNEGWPAFASPVRANFSTDLLAILRPLGAKLSSPTDAALLDYEGTADSCEAHGHNGGGLVDLFRASRAKARTMADAQSAALFNFTLTNPGPDVQPLLDAFGITTAAELRGPKGRAAIAAQALAKGVSQAVAVELANGLDDHFNWTTEQAPALRDGLDTLARLVGFLKNQTLPGHPGSVWSHTTLVVFSEFSRTPLVNGRNGRDHHLASSCLLAGPGLRGGRVIGGTTDRGMMPRKVNLVSGLPDDAAGVPLRPADVHATVLRSMQLDAGHLSNQSPRVVSALLRSA